MASLDASGVAKLLAEYGRRTALAGGNPYRSKAHLRAAESLAALAEPLGRIVAEGRLREIPGVGDAIADIITKLHRTGSHPSLERIRREIPGGVLEMLSIPGLRPDKVLKLHKQLGIASLAELEAASREDRSRLVSQSPTPRSVPQSVIKAQSLSASIPIGSFFTWLRSSPAWPCGPQRGSCRRSSPFRSDDAYLPPNASKCESAENCGVSARFICLGSTSIWDWNMSIR
jgi:hypothetical protein